MPFFEIHIFRSFSTEKSIFGHFGPKKWRKWRKWRIFLIKVWFHKGKILKIFLTFFNVSDTVIFGPFFAKFSAEKNMARKFSDPKFGPRNKNSAFLDRLGVTIKCRRSCA